MVNAFRTLAKIVLLIALLSVSGFAQDCATLEKSTPSVEPEVVKERLISLEWPGPPPGAKLEGVATLKVTVSSQGDVICVTPVQGHRLLLAGLTKSLYRWLFVKDAPFVGTVAIQYASEGYRLL